MSARDPRQYSRITVDLPHNRKLKGASPQAKWLSVVAISDEFSRAFVRWFDRQPLHKQDQITALFREAVDVVNRMAEFMYAWEAAGIEAAEEFANGRDR